MQTLVIFEGIEAENHIEQLLREADPMGAILASYSIIQRCLKNERALNTLTQVNRVPL